MQLGVHRYTPPGGRRRKNTPTYSSWLSMHSRCYGSHSPSYEGVEVCDRWRRQGGTPDAGFLNFLEDMGERPEGTTLGRFGDEGDYGPGNCAWMTTAEQAANRR